MAASSGSGRWEGVLIADRGGKVLLVHPTYHKDRWLFPGGMESERQDTPQRAAAREVAEELVFVFDGGVVDEETKQGFRTPQDELRGRWSRGRTVSPSTWSTGFPLPRRSPA